MTVSGLPTDLIRVLSMSVVVTSVIVVETRRLRFSSMVYAIQALFIVGLLLCFAQANPALYWWAGTAFLTKAVLTPAFLLRYIGKTQETELPPLIGFGSSLVVAALLIVGLFRLTHSQIGLLAASPLEQTEVFRTNLAVAATVFILGLYAVLTRRDAVKTVIGLCLLENGVHLSLVSMAPALPETALFGVATEVVVTVFLLLYVIAGVYQQFGTTDTLQMRELHG